jgi:hypothetical protein
MRWRLAHRPLLEFEAECSVTRPESFTGPGSLIPNYMRFSAPAIDFKEGAFSLRA